MWAACPTANAPQKRRACHRCRSPLHLAPVPSRARVFLAFAAAAAAAAAATAAAATTPSHTRRRSRRTCEIVSPPSQPHEADALVELRPASWSLGVEEEEENDDDADGYPENLGPVHGVTGRRFGEGMGVRAESMVLVFVFWGWVVEKRRAFQSGIMKEDPESILWCLFDSYTTKQAVFSPVHSLCRRFVGNGSVGWWVGWLAVVKNCWPLLGSQRSGIESNCTDRLCVAPFCFAPRFGRCPFRLGRWVVYA
ncbi:hypothetical protein BKA80DRAFT_329953 [Phyllosticta citrichinensis]